MNKLATYTGFVLAGLTDATLFITSTSHAQLALAIVLYLPLAYVAFKLFPRKTQQQYTTVRNTSSDSQIPSNYSSQVDTVDQTNSKSRITDGVDVLDFDKRAFLKLIGATGLAFFISSLFTKRAEGLLLGKAEEATVTSIKDPIGNVINPAKHHPTDNYKISEVEYGVDTYYGFIDRSEGWFIMKEDLNAGTYRYAKGDTNFYANWNARNDLKYDFFNRVFPEP
jgi:hypothetical protein